MEPLDQAVLPPGVRARFVDGVNGLRMHILEAGYETPGRPCVMLLHGFPEIAYSWRNQMIPLAQAGYHVVAPDQRGYGRTEGADFRYDGDLASFRALNTVRDIIGLLFRLGHREAAAVVGHDYGASVAAWCALVRPDVFHRMAIMSAPFGGPPALPFGDEVAKPDGVHDALAGLARPRKHYHQYYSTRPANEDMWHCKQGVHDFLRAYYHHKSADWTDNKPFRLAGWTAEELAKMPTYYVMDLHENMAQTVAHHMPRAEQIAASQWLTEDALRVYSGEYQRNGFQGGLNLYRVRTSGVGLAEQQVFAGRTIDVPAMFVAGQQDWGSYQSPGALEKLQEKVCTKFVGCHLLDGAGHWVQQEQHAAVTGLLLKLLKA